MIDNITTKIILNLPNIHCKQNLIKKDATLLAKLVN